MLTHPAVDSGSIHSESGSLQVPEIIITPADSSSTRSPSPLSVRLTMGDGNRSNASNGANEANEVNRGNTSNESKASNESNESHASNGLNESKAPNESKGLQNGSPSTGTPVRSSTPVRISFGAPSPPSAPLNPATSARRRVPRKQAIPQRSLKELVSVVDKIINGVIVIDPNCIEGWYYRQFSHSGISRAFRDSKANVAADERQRPPQRKNRKRKTADDSSPTSFDDDVSEEGDGKILNDEDDEAEDTVVRKTNGLQREWIDYLVDPETGKAEPLNPNSRCNIDPAHHRLPEDADIDGIRLRLTWLLELNRQTRFTPSFWASLGSDRSSGFAMTPLNILQCPGVGLLLDRREFVLCALLRIQPVQYFANRETLVRNWHRDGYFKKSAAQKMLHIDVNKTGRLYDFLVMMGWLPASASAEAAAAVRPLPENGWKRIINGH